MQGDGRDTHSVPGNPNKPLPQVRRTPPCPGSINILLIAALALEIGDERNRLVDRARAVLGHDVN